MYFSSNAAAVFHICASAFRWRAATGDLPATEEEHAVLPDGAFADHARLDLNQSTVWVRDETRAPNLPEDLAPSFHRAPTPVLWLSQPR